MRRTVSALIYPAFYSGTEWLFLLLHRIPMPKLGLCSFWQGITGAAEGDETPIQAARRELLEETHITTDKLEPTNYSYRIPMQPEWKEQYYPGTEWTEEYVFTAILTSRQTPKLSLEHNDWKWCHVDEAIHMLRYADNVEGLRRCNDLVQGAPYGLRQGHSR